MARGKPSPSIKVNDLAFAFPDGTTGLQNIKLDLPAGSRTLLIGGELSNFKHDLLYTEC